MQVIGKVVGSAPAKERSDSSDHLPQLSGRASELVIGKVVGSAPAKQHSDFFPSKHPKINLFKATFANKDKPVVGFLQILLTLSLAEQFQIASVQSFEVITSVCLAYGVHHITLPASERWK